MNIIRGFKNLENVNIGLGLFDGVHVGHRELIRELVSVSKSEKSIPVLITFTSSPSEKYNSDFKYLTTLTERETLLSGLGVEYLVELDFDEILMNTKAENYLEKLYYFFKPKYIFTGFNHTFGKERLGTPEMLEKYQKKYNYKYKIIEPVKYENSVVSSTLIKKFLETGDIENANELLCNKYSISGAVIKGNQIGQKLGYPTANIKYPENKVQIPFGVYSAEVVAGGCSYKGMLNYGIKPTINDNKNEPVAEVHIIGFNKDIYGEELKISIIKKIRDEKKFESLDELKNQIKRDVDLC